MNLKAKRNAGYSNGTQGQAGMGRPQTARKIAKILVKITAGSMIFVGGLTLGNVSGTHQPSASTMTKLHEVQSASNTPCWAEWNEIQRDYEIICDTNPSVRGAAPLR